MRLRHALSVAAAVWTAAPAAAAEDPRPHPARHAAPKRPAAQPAAPGEAATTPLFPENAAAGTDADRAAALERRRKAFFATPPDGPAAADAPPVGVTLGGSGGLTPSMGLKF